VVRLLLDYDRAIKTKKLEIKEIMSEKLTDGKMMKAVRVHAPMDLRVDEIPVPKPKAGEVLLKIAYGGICGSDISYWRKAAAGVFVLQDPPLTLGHEFSGTIAEIGSSEDASEDAAKPVQNLKVGQKVCVFPPIFENEKGETVTPEFPERLKGRDNLWPKVRYFGSGAVVPHQDGGLVEYLIALQEKIVPIPDNISLKEAAAVEPLSVALHAVNRAKSIFSDVRGKKIFVNGSGAIGGFVIAVLKHFGAEVECGDISDFSLGIAKKLGVKKAYNVLRDEIKEKYEIVFEASGVPKTYELVCEIADLGGLIVQVGNLPRDFAQYKLGYLVSKELIVTGSFRFTEKEFHQAVELLADGLDIKPLLTDVFEIDDALKAFETSMKDESAKVLIKL
jgi:L-idonate 5-dehydrogenase